MSTILFVLNSAEGGATISAMQLMTGLAQRGHRCFAVCPPSTKEALARLSGAAEIVEQLPLPWWNRNYKARWFKRPIHHGLELLRSGFYLGSTNELVRLIDAWRIEVVHSNTAVTLVGAMAAVRAQVPHVWHIREQIGHGQLFRFWLPEPALARTFVGLSDALIANSRESRMFFERNGCGDRVEIIHNGVPIEDFDRPQQHRQLRSRWGAADDDVVVGMVANLTSRMKQHEVFVRAAARIARTTERVRFVVVGHDPETEGGSRSELDYARGNKQLAADLGLSGRFVWTGSLMDPSSVMAALDVLVHPSDRESFGRVAVEAMAASKPVVGADSGGLREIIEDGVTGFRSPAGDDAAFASSIVKLVRDRELRARMGAAGRHRVERSFSLAQTVTSVERCYDRALAMPSAR